MVEADALTFLAQAVGAGLVVGVVLDLVSYLR